MAARTVPLKRLPSGASASAGTQHPSGAARVPEMTQPLALTCNPSPISMTYDTEMRLAISRRVYPPLLPYNFLSLSAHNNHD